MKIEFEMTDDNKKLTHTLHARISVHASKSQQRQKVAEEVGLDKENIHLVEYNQTGWRKNVVRPS